MNKNQGIGDRLYFILNNKKIQKNTQKVNNINKDDEKEQIL